MIQLDRWHKALVAFSALAKCEAIVPTYSSSAETTDRFRDLGLPKMPLLCSDVVIPNPVQVSGMLSALIDALLELAGDEPQGAEIWRRLCIGVQASQVDAQSGAIPNVPLAWLPARRIRCKQSALWVRQLYEGRAFVLALSSGNDLSVLVGDLPLRTHLQNAGVNCASQLSSFLKRCANRVRRAESLITLLSCPGRHVSSSLDDARFVCLSCHQVSPLSHALAWMRRPCPMFDQSKAGECANALRESATLERTLMRRVKALLVP